MKRVSEIVIKVSLDKDQMPEKIEWATSDNPQDGVQESKTMMLGLWDPKEKSTLSMDLWTKDMPIDEMHTHFFQRILSLADSYQRATGNPFVAAATKKYCEELGERTQVWEERGRKHR
ncbi:MAG: gliding motility protein GldC [Chitinophagales bacterium]|nr:gliding motility protein GldC [Chitinophagales bacterium]